MYCFAMPSGGRASSLGLQRAGPAVPEDLAGAAIYLASAASDYVSGHVLYVDGGYTTCDTI